MLVRLVTPMERPLSSTLRGRNPVLSAISLGTRRSASSVGGYSMRSRNSTPACSERAWAISLEDPKASFPRVSPRRSPVMDCCAIATFSWASETKPFDFKRSPSLNAISERHHSWFQHNYELCLFLHHFSTLAKISKERD